MPDAHDAADPLRGVHFAHCYQGDYRHCCKYGDERCPAAVNDVPDHPDDRTLDVDDRAVALVRHLAASTGPEQLEQARQWARGIMNDMEN